MISTIGYMGRAVEPKVVAEATKISPVPSTPTVGSMHGVATLGGTPPPPPSDIFVVVCVIT